MKTKTKFLFLFIATMMTGTLFAQRTTDVENSKDYPMVSRFQGAVIEFYKETKWGTYKLPLEDKGKITWSSFTNAKVLDGKIIRIQYSAPVDNTPAFVLQNYKVAFTKAGFTVLTAVSDEGLGVGGRSQDWSSQYYGSGDAYWTNALNNGKFGLDKQIPGWKAYQSYIVAHAKKDGKDIYVSVYAVDHDTYVLINQDVIEVEAAATGMVTAENISKGILSDGHIAVYDILFETGSTVIKPESGSAVKVIADYLIVNPSQKFLIVGHTDNVGTFDANIKLSEERAKALMNELTSKYSIKPEQVKAYGVASLAPVSSNSTEEGRAKNRRVEIVQF